MFASLLILALIGELGNDSFRSREEATRALAALGGTAVPHLRRALADDDPEVRVRAHRLLDDWRARYRPTQHALSPWLDLLPPDYPDRGATINKYLDLAGQGMYVDGYNYNHTTRDWPLYRQATVLFIDDLILRGESRRDITQLLDRMAEKEVAYWKRQEQEEAGRPPGD